LYQYAKKYKKLLYAPSAHVVPLSSGAFGVVAKWYHALAREGSIKLLYTPYYGL